MKKMKKFVAIHSQVNQDISSIKKKLLLSFSFSSVTLERSDAGTFTQVLTQCPLHRSYDGKI